jgi:hypothetical protein
MGSLERRLSRLEAKNPGPTLADEEVWKQLWLNAKRGKRVREHRNPDESHAGGIFRLLRLQERLATTREEVEAQILSWRPPPSEVATRRVVARAIYDQEEGTENMVCPPEWRGSFAAGEEFRERYIAMPDEALVEAFMRLQEIEEDEEDGLACWNVQHRESFGITEDLLQRAVGPDFGEITEEERMRRLNVCLADADCDEKEWRVCSQINRLREEEGGLEDAEQMEERRKGWIERPYKREEQHQ